MRVRLRLAYDGTDFHGWASQPGLRTVSGELRAGLLRVLGHGSQVSIVVAGRTDAGVHARGQVAHVDLPSSRWRAVAGRSGLDPAQSLPRRLAGVLPPDLAVLAAEEVPATFDARFSATGRRYTYRIADARPGPDPLLRRLVLSVRESIDAEQMHRAGQALLGEHDFLAYCRPRPDASTVRTVRELRVRRSLGDGHVDGTSLVLVSVTADAFCHHQVRSLVGALLEVGRGRRSQTWPAELLATRSRSAAAPVAPAHGLTLEGVDYPPPQEWAEQARAARRYRGGIEQVRPAGQGPS